MASPNTPFLSHLFSLMSWTGSQCSSIVCHLVIPALLPCISRVSYNSCDIMSFFILWTFFLILRFLSLLFLTFLWVHIVFLSLSLSMTTPQSIQKPTRNMVPVVLTALHWLHISVGIILLVVSVILTDPTEKLSSLFCRSHSCSCVHCRFYPFLHCLGVVDLRLNLSLLFALFSLLFTFFGLFGLFGRIPRIEDGST
jgi:hypothetical protein